MQHINKLAKKFRFNYKNDVDRIFNLWTTEEFSTNISRSLNFTCIRVLVSGVIKFGIVLI